MSEKSREEIAALLKAAEETLTASVEPRVQQRSLLAAAAEGLGGPRVRTPEPEPFPAPAVNRVKPAPERVEREVAKFKKQQLQRELVTKEDGTLKGHAAFANALTLLRYHPDLAESLAFNDFSRYMVIRKKLPWGKYEGEHWTDHDGSHLLEWMEREGCYLGSSAKAAEAAATVARENRFHPFRDYLKSIEWDNTPRLSNWLITYAGAEDTLLNRAMGERWMIAAVARIFQPGCQVDSYLQLEGPQGIGKSSLLRTLAGDEYFTDHVSELGSKDSRIELHGRVIIEYSELDRIKGRDLNRVKSFLTARFDCFRPPYGRSVENVPRGCVFAATTNDYNSLSDETGGRRCWPVRCGTINVTQLGCDRDQLWAEAYHLYTRGEKWHLDTPELIDAAREEQEARYDGGVWDDPIMDWLEDPKQRYEDQLPIEPFESTSERTTVTEILLHAIGKPLDRQSLADKREVAKCLIHAGWEHRQHRAGVNRGKWFYVRSK